MEDLYAEVRRIGVGEEAWHFWLEARDELFATHPQSPSVQFDGPRSVACGILPRSLVAFPSRVESPRGGRISLSHSGFGSSPFKRFGVVRFSYQGHDLELTLYWLDTYGGVSARDATNGKETDGGRRFLLDTVKGADLGREGRKLVLDFKFAYHPSVRARSPMVVSIGSGREQPITSSRPGSASLKEISPANHLEDLSVRGGVVSSFRL